MSANQDKAKARLEQYQEAVEDLQYLSDRIETLEARVMRSTTALDVSAGWTGEYWGKSKHGRGWIVVNDPTLLRNPIKLMRVPKGQRKDKDPKAGEKVMVGMIDLIIDYETKAQSALKLCKEIEGEIEEYCSGDNVNVLRYRYIEGLTYGAIARRLMYSERHLRAFLMKL